jgi:hypothetical protein
MSMNPEPRTKLPIAALLLCGGLVAAFVAVVAVARGDEPDLTEEIAARQARQAAPGESVSCPNGQAVQTYFQRDADRFEVIGTLTSLTAESLTRDAPQGEVVLAVATNVDTSGDPIPGDLARIQGSVARDGVFVASGIEGVCEVFVQDVSPETAAPTPTEQPSDEAAAPTDDTAGDDDENNGGLDFGGDEDNDDDGNNGNGNGNGNGGDNGRGEGQPGGGGDDDDDDDDGDDD